MSGEKRTALERKSRWACVSGLFKGAGLEAASCPSFGILCGALDAVEYVPLKDG